MRSIIIASLGILAGCGISLICYYWLEIAGWIRRHNVLWIQSTINAGFYRPDTVIIKPNDFDYIVVDGFKFHTTDQIDSVQRVKGNPWFQGIRHGDVVLDIGANIGSVTIPLAATASRVFAVEPLFAKELGENVRLNQLNNVLVIPKAMGQGPDSIIKFGPHKAVCKKISFKELISLMKTTENHIDFFKCDCEGAEWDIELASLKGIREMRLELHIRRGNIKNDKKKYAEWLKWLDNNGYAFTVDRRQYSILNLIFDSCSLVNASLKDGK